MKMLQGKLTYANVISTLCLFLLLGGGAAFAATQLPKNSVGSKQLKKSSVTAAKIKNGAVTQAKIAMSAQNALKGGTGPVGPQGARGPQGPTGPSGIAGVQAVDGPGKSMLAGTANDIFASCPNGEHLIGGGYRDENQTAASIDVLINSPDPNSPTTTWFVRIHNTSAETIPATAVAICAVTG
ncbi:MAG: hypothetical protein QOH04_1391 [Sphingomonadales bacterium]|jgi:hypothetical protein|nr:hypothetical protein [Sphingomonadales bacterium]